MALSKYYVNHDTGDDTLGTGTSVAPWATLQKAFNSITRTDEDCIFVSGNKTYVGTFALNTYGDRPTGSGMTLIVGVGSPRPVITYTDGTSLFRNAFGGGPNVNGFQFVNLEFVGTHATPSQDDFVINQDSKFQFCKLDMARGLSMSTASVMEYCEVMGGDGAFTYLISYVGTIRGCYFHNVTTDFVIQGGTDSILDRNVIIGAESSVNSTRRMLNPGNAINMVVSSNIFVEGASGFTGGLSNNTSLGLGMVFEHNIIVSSRSGDIFAVPGNVWSLRGNRKHSTPTWGTGAGDAVNEGNINDDDLTLANWGKVFVDPANGDFRLRKNWTSPSPFGADPLMFPAARFPGTPAFASLG